jgi:hypothetical protein
MEHQLQSLTDLGLQLCHCAAIYGLSLHRKKKVPILLYFVWMILYYDIHIDDKECKASMFLSFVLFPALFNDPLSNTLFMLLMEQWL